MVAELQNHCKLSAHFLLRGWAKTEYICTVFRDRIFGKMYQFLGPMCTLLVIQLKRFLTYLNKLSDPSFNDITKVLVWIKSRLYNQYCFRANHSMLEPFKSDK